MKIGIISDTHQNFNYLDKVLKIFQQEAVELIIHLGDNYCDLGQTVRGIKVLKVPGVYDPEYENPRIAHRQVIELVGTRILMTHSPQLHEKDASDDLAPLELALREKVNLILYGHTHIPSLEERGGFIWLNPGHLKIEDKKGYPATYGLVELEPGKLKAYIINLDDQQVLINYPPAQCKIN